MAKHRVKRREIRPPDRRRWVGRSLVSRDDNTATIRLAAAVATGPSTHARVPLGSYTIPLAQLAGIAHTLGRIPLADKRTDGTDVRTDVHNTGCRLIVLPNVKGDNTRPADPAASRKHRENTRGWYERCRRLAERTGGRVQHEPGTHSPLRMAGGVVIYYAQAATAAAAVCVDPTAHGWLAYAPAAAGIAASVAGRLVWLPTSAIRAAGAAEWAA